MGQGESALATPCRPPDVDIARAVLLPLGQTVQQPSQSHIQESSGQAPDRAHHGSPQIVGVYQGSMGHGPVSNSQDLVKELLPLVEFGAYPVAEQVSSYTGSQRSVTECAACKPRS